MLQLSYLKQLHSCSSSKWKSVVGLEIHAQIKAVSKLFSGASTNFHTPVNTSVSLFDCATPGTLPVLNKQCVEAAILTALALNCKISPISMFDRKHYFYADMPAGYQITQQQYPLATDGHIDFKVYHPLYAKTAYWTRSKIKQIQLEQDSGKSLHDTDRSLIDLNRAGIPLMELVFEPDLSNGEEAAGLVKELCTILESIDVCSCKMEEGALRVDANVSVHKEDAALGIRTEIKNISSIRAVANAVRYEIGRQINVLENCGVILNETRMWDSETKTTVIMRDKEVVQDYRFMPEPNLPPLHVAVEDVGPDHLVSVSKLKKRVPELPQRTRIRLHEACGLTLDQATILVNDRHLLRYFEAIYHIKKVEGRFLANLLINDFLRQLHSVKKTTRDIDINTAPKFLEIFDLLQDQKVTRIAGRLLMTELINGNKEKPSVLVEENKWQQNSNEVELRSICENIMKNSSKLVKQYKNGKTAAFDKLMLIVRKHYGINADIIMCTNIMKDLLKKD